MLLKQRVSAVVDNKPEVIWDYASDPKNWSASNTLEHRGLKIFSKSGLPETGATFHQKEYVAGFFADLQGHFLYVERPKVCVWTGIASYKLLGGLLKIRISEGGTVTLTKVDKGWEFVHDVYMDYSDSLFGRLLYWSFINLFNGQKAVFAHANREVVYFKTQLEKEK